MVIKLSVLKLYKINDNINFYRFYEKIKLKKWFNEWISITESL